MSDYLMPGRPPGHFAASDARSTFYALNNAVNDLVGRAPEDHDVLVQAFDILVEEIHFLQPHTLIFRGRDQEGNYTSVVIHYSQTIARVIYLPKRGPERVITGFAPIGNG